MPRYVEGGASGGGGGNSEKGFLNKPAKGWQHSERILLNEGVTFNVRYIGCLEIKTSMKQLDFTMRSQVAKECINRVCEAASLITSSKKRRIDKRVEQCICDNPIMKQGGSNVTLTICSKYLSLKNFETNEIIAKHDMPRISFASGGDSDTLDFVAFVAKNLDEWRACYVLECGGGLAQNLISTIGQAFELRFNEYFNKTQDMENLNTDKEYYNDLPGKLPPELLNSGNGSGGGGGCDNNLLQSTGATMKNNTSQSQQQSTTNTLSSATGTNPKKNKRNRLSSNLIDFNSPTIDHEYVNERNNSDLNSNDGACGGFDDGTAAAASTGFNNSGTPPTTTTSSSSSSIPTSKNNTSGNISTRDVFDMQPFSLAAEVQRSQIMTEFWFHGMISRGQSEELLKRDGDFLVRESKAKLGQYVLTGLQSQTPKHLLLIDPEGVVRTKDRIFDSISHLINYHWTNSLPIISEESALVLRNPIAK